jgi:hypothetical protein
MSGIGTGEIFFVLYYGAVIGVGIFILKLLSRFVKAHERVATALEDVARNSRPNSKL